MFNNLINHLRLWCSQKGQAYREYHENYDGVAYVGCLVAEELHFQLSTLIDKPFKHIEDLKETISNLMEVHYAPAITHPQNKSAEHLIDKTKQEFRTFTEEIIAQIDTLPMVDLPYMRVITGTEAVALREKFRSVWGYVNTSYWYPLMGDEPKEVAEKFFIMFDHVEPYIPQIAQIIGLPETHIYCCGEDIFMPKHCVETAEMFEAGECETIYTDKDFTWAIYISHEDTVAFAGAIVPKIKELLSNEKEHWNRFVW